jgi:hypothetical protein
MPKSKGSLQKQNNALFVVSEDQSQDIELETDNLVLENGNIFAEDISPASNSSFHLSGSDGKPGFISFYNRSYRRDSDNLLLNSERSQNSILWFMGPAVLVASFILPSLYLRKVLSFIFEDSLLTGNVYLKGRLTLLFLFFVCIAILHISLFWCEALSIIWLCISQYVSKLMNEYG